MIITTTDYIRSSKDDTQSDAEKDNAAIGYWVLPGNLNHLKVRFQAFKKPRWITRFLMKLLIEWEWEDRHY